MSSVKVSLHTTIDSLSEKDAREILKFARLLKEKREVSLSLKRLDIDKAFKIPTDGVQTFRTVKPVQGRGIPASRLLLEDRR